MWRLSPASPLCCQPPPHGEQVRRRRGDLQAMQILRQATVAHHLEAEHALDGPDAVLDLRTHSRLVAILGLDRLIDSLPPSVAPVDAVASPRSDGLDNVAMALVA